MYRYVFVVTISLLLASSLGCNRRCNSPGGCGPFASNSRIQAPRTGGLQIPSRMAAGGEPYYVPGNPGTNLSQAIDPRQSAPTIAGNETDLNGWTRTAQAAPFQSASQAPNYNQMPNQYAPTSYALPGYRVSSGTTLSSGNSTTGGQGGGTTTAWENDPSRIPLTDASGIRAPSQLATNAQFQSPVGQLPMQPQRFTANVNVFQPMPGQQAYPGNSMNQNSNPILPQQPARYQAELMASGAPQYQSPYARTAAGTLYQSGPYGDAASNGWSPR